MSIAPTIKEKKQKRKKKERETERSLFFKVLKKKQKKREINKKTNSPKITTKRADQRPEEFFVCLFCLRGKTRH